jgi:hypothetical protein
VFLIAARHIDATRAETRLACLEAAPTSQLIRLGRQELDQVQWSAPINVQNHGQPRPVREIVPLFTCRLEPEAATFHLVTRFRAMTAHLVEAWRTQLPAGFSEQDAPTWAHSCYEQQAAINIGTNRFGLRMAEEVEVETKFTLEQDTDPLALALTIKDALGARDTTLTHRILRSHIYAPTAPAGATRYAAFTPRPDGGWWAKAKHDVAPETATRRELHRVVPDLDAGLAWASATLERDLHLLGHMHRTCWDQVTDPDPNGDMSVITVDSARMREHTLHQVEVEYAARLALLAPSAADARSHVQATAANLARHLTEAGAKFRRDGLTKLDFFRRAGASHAS